MPAPETGALLGPGDVGTTEREALATRAVVVPRTDLARFRLTGGGRVTCLQGLVTCDLAQPGDGAYVFGALLTAKGMIVAPLWITRLADAMLVDAPADAAAAVAATFERSLPPRLCRWDDVTAASAAVGVYGPRAPALLSAVVAGVLPEQGRAALLEGDGVAIAAARVAARGVDGFDCAVAADRASSLVERLLEAGALPASPALLEERRILAGFPRTGAEIDDRTLPQEVRFDELGGVSYTKGCYLGQETVARVHFRGHANRRLAGVALASRPPALPCVLAVDGQAVGRLSSACWWDAGGIWAGLGIVRMGLASGGRVALPDGSVGTIRELPWSREREDHAP